MNIKDVIKELAGLFPEQSVNVSVDLWHHVYNGARCANASPSWRIHISAEPGVLAKTMTFGGTMTDDRSVSLEKVMQEVRDFLAREKMESATIDSTRESLKGL